MSPPIALSDAIDRIVSGLELEWDFDLDPDLLLLWPKALRNRFGR